MNLRPLAYKTGVLPLSRPVLRWMGRRLACMWRYGLGEVIKKKEILPRTINFPHSSEMPPCYVAMKCSGLGGWVYYLGPGEQSREDREREGRKTGALQGPEEQHWHKAYGPVPRLSSLKRHDLSAVVFSR